jgi:uncharacterized repeat protein (TIGR01451 family)
MSRFVPLVAVALLVVAAQPVAAQSADQEVVSVVDSPDPVVPGQAVTYTVVLRNHGPNPATNGGLNAIIDANIAFTLPTAAQLPPGFSCGRLGQSLTCNTPSFAPGTVTITLTGQLSSHLNSFPDGSVSSLFYPSGTTPDPNHGNDQKTAVTAYDTPQVDLTIAVVDTPDPVRPDETITYTATVTNDGPDPATNVNFNVFNNGSLRFQSATPGAGFACNLPPVGGNPAFTCSRTTVPVGTYTFTVTVLADDAVLGVHDGTVSTVLSVLAGASNETDHSDNSETEDTAYVTPDADLAVSVVDGPDPGVVEDPVDFLVTVVNNGPDPTTSTQLNIVGDGGLQFVAIDPANGYSCTSQIVGAPPSMTCTAASLAVGASAEFLVTLRSDEDQLGEDGGTVMTLFGVNSGLTDPVTANNTETESTTFVPFRLFRDGFEW